MKNNERPSPVKVGEKLRNLRKKKGLTLKKLSEKAELSIGYLSNLERDACSPTLENIQKICGILDVSLSELLEENIESRTVIKKNERTVIFEKEGAVCYESIVFGEDEMEGLCITLEPHTKYDA